MVEVIYTPRVEDEVVVASFKTEAEAEQHMEEIKELRPKAYPHHYIKKGEMV